MTAPTITFSDDFSGSGDLNGSPVGASSIDWSALAGSWSRSGGLAACSAAPSASPILVADFGKSDVTLQVGCYTGFAGGDALYFRVSDTANWWRLRCRTQQTTSSYVDTTYTYGPWVTQYTYTAPYGQDTYNAYVGGEPTIWDNCHVINGANSTWEHNTRTYTANSQTYYYTNQYRYLVLEKCVAGTVTQVTSWQVSSFAKLAAHTAGSVITVYEPDGTTVHGTATDSFNSAATEHGIGKGGSDSYSYSSALDNFTLSFLGSTTPPSITSPVNGADVDIAGGVGITVVSNFGASDPLTSADIQWRNSGATDWTVIDAALTGPGTYTLAEADLTAGAQVEAQVRGTDTYGNTTGWSASVFFTPRTVPDAPVFVAPASGATVVAADIATVNFDSGTDSTARDARRIGDLSGNPDPTVVYQDPLTLTLIDSGADAGDYLLTGDAATHPTGPEHIQARRQTADGGSLWSLWADLPVTMSLAPPQVPLVTLTPDPGTGSVRVDGIFPPAGDADHSDAVRMDVYRDQVRVASIDVADGRASWTDWLAGPASDYRVDAVAANTAVASFQ